VPPIDQSYETLGLDTHASEEAVRRAFRRLACQTHPDLHPDDPTAARRFRRVAEAYHSILANAAKADDLAVPAIPAMRPAIRPWRGVDIRIGGPPSSAPQPSFADILAGYLSAQHRPSPAA
jgi:uncharacterized membrane protein YccC